MIIALSWEPVGTLRPTAGWAALLLAIPMSQILTSVPRLGFLRDAGLVPAVAAVLWARGVAVLWRRTRASDASGGAESSSDLAAGARPAVA
jgi:hypothetical protein